MSELVACEYLDPNKGWTLLGKFAPTDSSMEDLIKQLTKKSL